MTPEEKVQYKSQCKEALTQYLTNKGIINSEPERIFQELPNMYRHLEEKGLIKYGLTYQIFHKIAHEQFMFSQIMRSFR